MRFVLLFVPLFLSAILSSLQVGDKTQPAAVVHTGPAVPLAVCLGYPSSGLDSLLTSQPPCGLFSLQSQNYKLFPIFPMNLTCSLLYLASRKCLSLLFIFSDGSRGIYYRNLNSLVIQFFRLTHPSP